MSTVGAMSGISGESIAAIVRQALSARGPMTEDDLLLALDGDSIDLGRMPRRRWLRFSMKIPS